MEDCCAVCAEPLEWTAYGPCGHTEACSKCVMRLRFVMDDKRCVICQQINPSVLVTRFMGSYTSTLPASEFPSLGRRPGLDYLPSTQAYFDDKLHFDEIRGLCSFSHPELKEDNGQMLVFRSINQLKRQLVDTRHLQLCNICVENRKVFIPEQVAYSKPDLERHMRTGDLTGPMAESGFKGHPQCRFCRTRFFSDSELFIHMQSAHEQCFLCRRAHPDRYIYYKDYNELEDHFRHEHYLCNHQTCLDRKFIVFMTEQELKQHAAREHGGDMSKAERRQALTIPINFQYSRGQEAAGGPSGRARHEAGGPGSITIGGSGNVRSRFALRSQEDHHHLSSALHASVESAQTEDALRASAAVPSASADPTPAEAEGQGPAFSGPRHYLAAAGSRGGGNLRAEDFPALPGTSKSARKRTKDKDKQKLGGQRSTSESDLAGSIAQALAQSSSTPNFHEDEEAVREPEWQEVRAPAQRQLAQQQRLSKLQGRAAAAAAANGSARRPEPSDPFPPINGSSRSAGSSRTVSPGPARAAAELPASNGASPAAPSSSAREVFPALGPPAASTRQLNLRSWGPGSSAAPEQRTAPQKQRSQAEDFPALGKAASSAGRPPAPQPAASVSDSVKAANKAFLRKVKAQLSEEQLDEFRREASNFLQGNIDGPTYYRLVVSLGLGAMVPEMAALLPDENRRAELLSAHSAAQESDLAADAAAAHAMQFGSWQCNRCSLINGPDTRSCEACNSRRPQGAFHGSSNGSAQPQDTDGPQEDGFPSLGAPHASSSSGNPNGKDAKQQKKGKKVSKFERLRLTGGDPEATLAWMDTEGGRKPPTNPQNAWTQGRPAVSAGSGGSQPRGQWSKQGKLAHEWRTIQDAWSQK